MVKSRDILTFITCLHMMRPVILPYNLSLLDHLMFLHAHSILCLSRYFLGHPVSCFHENTLSTYRSRRVYFAPSRGKLSYCGFYLPEMQISCCSYLLRSLMPEYIFQYFPTCLQVVMKIYKCH